MAGAEFRYADLLPAGADDTPQGLDLVAQGAQDPAVRLWVRLLVASDAKGVVVGAGQLLRTP
ncbi:MAG: hypothetical protein M3324_05960 [Actinomycetota bacterium]|nr:hypothetical protein [Actinomycetota bacterium]